MESEKLRQDVQRQLQLKSSRFKLHHKKSPHNAGFFVQVIHKNIKIVESNQPLILKTALHLTHLYFALIPKILSNKVLCTLTTCCSLHLHFIESDQYNVNNLNYT